MSIEISDCCSSQKAENKYIMILSSQL